MKIDYELLKQCNGKCPPDIMKKAGVKRFVEIGIRRGKSFFNHINGVSELAVAVDIWTDTKNPAQNDANYSQATLNEQYNRFIQKVEEIENPEIKVIKDFSVNASKEFEDEFFDWVFIDADHSYEGCKEDIEHWYPKLKSGGVFCGHDYMEHEVKWNGVVCGVKQAVDEFVENNNLDLFVYKGSSNPTWYLIKK